MLVISGFFRRVLYQDNRLALAGVLVQDPCPRGLPDSLAALGTSWDLVTTYERASSPSCGPTNWPYVGCPSYQFNRVISLVTKELLSPMSLQVLASRFRTSTVGASVIADTAVPYSKYRDSTIHLKHTSKCCRELFRPLYITLQYRSESNC